MKLTTCLTLICLTASCASPVEKGDFCDLAHVMATEDADLAAHIVAADRDLAQEMTRQNRLIGECQ